MKAIRRSIKGEKSEVRPSHISLTPKSATAINPPKKVIKALYDYNPDPTRPEELGFHKGDFFHVIGRENDDDWYEACNPLITSARGLVPVSYFEIIGKTERQSTGSNGSSTAASASGLPRISAPVTASSNGVNGMDGGDALKSPNPSHARASSMSKGAMVYGIVQYDFNAERPDELEAKAGEAIIVIAQSNPEWFVAKPIGRLGGPGLIPVSFIEVRDMSTNQAVEDPLKAVQIAGVPRVEQWKKLAADYKNNSISLGKFEGANGGSMDRVQQGMDRMSLNNGQQQYPNGNRGPTLQAPAQPLLAPTRASIPRYCFENDKYWYIIECVMEDGSHWELSRYYQNFYDFQIALLQQFPDESGNNGGNRILPYMPGPVTYVTDAISNGRRESLDVYVKQLLSLPDYISKCNLVRQLFAPKDGDFELDPKAMEEDYRLSRASQHSSSAANSLSRQSSQQQLNGGYPQARGQNVPRYATPTQQQAQGGNAYGGPGVHPALERQISSLTQNSVSSSNFPSGSPHPPAATSGTGSALKIKVWFEDDCIAIRVPSQISFGELRSKLHERLKVAKNSDLLIQYRDEPSNQVMEMHNDEDLDAALDRNPKLQLYVGYVDGFR